VEGERSHNREVSLYSDTACTSDLKKKKQYVKAKIELYFVMFEAAISSEMSVHIYKIGRCHIHEDNKLNIFSALNRLDD